MLSPLCRQGNCSSEKLIKSLKVSETINKYQGHGFQLDLPNPKAWVLSIPPCCLLAWIAYRYCFWNQAIPDRFGFSNEPQNWISSLSQIPFWGMALQSVSCASMGADLAVRKQPCSDALVEEKRILNHSPSFQCLPIDPVLPLGATHNTPFSTGQPSKCLKRTISPTQIFPSQS